MLLSPETVERELRHETRKVSDALHFLAAAVQAADVAPAVERELRDMAGHIRNVGLDEAIRELERTRRVVRPRPRTTHRAVGRANGEGGDVVRRYGLILILALVFLLLLTCCSGETTAPGEPEPKPAQDTIYITLEEATWAEPLEEDPCRPPNCRGGR